MIKQQRKTEENYVEYAVNEWFDATRSQGQPLAGSLIRLNFEVCEYSGP